MRHWAVLLLLTAAGTIECVGLYSWSGLTSGVDGRHSWLAAVCCCSSKAAACCELRGTTLPRPLLCDILEVLVLKVLITIFADWVANTVRTGISTRVKSSIRPRQSPVTCSPASSYYHCSTAHCKPADAAGDCTMPPTTNRQASSNSVTSMPAAKASRATCNDSRTGNIPSAQAVKHSHSGCCSLVRLKHIKKDYVCCHPLGQFGCGRFAFSRRSQQQQITPSSQQPQGWVSLTCPKLHLGPLGSSSMRMNIGKLTKKYMA